MRNSREVASVRLKCKAIDSILFRQTEKNIILPVIMVHISFFYKTISFSRYKMASIRLAYKQRQNKSHLKGFNLFSNFLYLRDNKNIIQMLVKTGARHAS